MSWSTDNLTTDQRTQIARDSFQVKEVRGDELHGLCPAHEDHNASFSYNISKDACNCLACGFKGDLIALWGKSQGIGDNSEAFKAFRDRFGDGILTRPASGKRGPSTGQAGGAGKAEVKEEVEVTTVIPESDWEKLPLLPENWRKRCREKFGWSEDIIDRFGLRLRQMGDETRIAIPIRNDQGQLVNIRLYLPGAAENKLISWGKGFGKGKLFPAPPLPDDDPVIICEGEKDTLTALSQGFNAITQTCGVNSWSDKYNRFFQDHKVVIAYDNDDAGRKGAEKVAKQLAGTAASVWIIQWPPVMQDKQDVCDWFTTHGKTAEEFRDLILDAKQVAKSSKTGRSRAERAEEIPEEQQRYFIGKQFKARRCADHLLEDLKLAYDAASATLYRWNGKYWEEIHESIIRNRILAMLGDEGNTARVNDVCRVVEDLSIIKHGRKFNDRIDMLPLQNGMLDVSSGDFSPHDSENLNTYCLDVAFRITPDDMPTCNLWTQFLLDSIADHDTIKELQKYFGYCFTRETRHEKAMLLIGPGGDGKGTIIKILRSLLGEINCATVGMSDMLDQFHRVMLVDKLLNSTTEIRSEVFQSDLFKQLISGEPTSAAQKHKPAFSFNPVAKHIFSGNTYPAIKDHTDGLYRRLLIVEMDKQFATTGRADLYLFDKLMAERDAIFLWGLRGLQLLRKEGFTPSGHMLDNLDTFKQINNPMHNFVRDCIDSGGTGFTPSLDIYNAYKTYCAKRGNQAHSLTNAMMMLQSLCPWAKGCRKIVNGNKFKGYSGLILKQEGCELYE